MHGRTAKEKTEPEDLRFLLMGSTLKVTGVMSVLILICSNFARKLTGINSIKVSLGASYNEVCVYAAKNHILYIIAKKATFCIMHLFRMQSIDKFTHS